MLYPLVTMRKSAAALTPVRVRDTTEGRLIVEDISNHVAPAKIMEVIDLTTLGAAHCSVSQSASVSNAFETKFVAPSKTETVDR